MHHDYVDMHVFNICQKSASNSEFSNDRRYSTVGIPPLQAPYYCSLSSGVVTSLYEYDILEQDEKQLKINNL